MLYTICVAAGLIAGIVIMFFIIVTIQAKNGRRRKARKPITEPTKHKLSFSQFIVALYAFACIAWITADYVLAFMYQQPINTEVTVTLTTTVVVALLGYYAKSAFEKSSRNKYSLDEDGIPFNYDGEGG